MFIIAVLTLVLILASCDAVSDNTNPDKETSGGVATQPQEISVDFDDFFSYVALLDDSYIYFGNSDDNSTVTFYRAYFSGETLTLGQIRNFYLNMRYSDLIYPKLYFYVSVFDEVVGDVSNKIVCIDLSSNTMEEFEHYDGSIAGVPSCKFQDDIVSIKNNVEQPIVTTFVDIFDIDTGNWDKRMINTFNTESQTGTAIFGICADENYLYILYDDRKGDETDTYLKVYDKDYNEIKSIKIDEDIHDYVMTPFISYMQAFGGYIYIYNPSEYGFLGQIVGGDFVEVHKGHQFAMPLFSHFDDSGEILFYTHRSNEYYVFNTANGQFTEKAQFQIGGEYTVLTILTTANKAFIECYADDVDDYVYLVDRDGLANIVLPCE
jgi:outer membrane protein assembly factor BamB